MRWIDAPTLSEVLPYAELVSALEDQAAAVLAWERVGPGAGTAPGRGTP
ncbi:hypothetical protein [Deferrisoma palaeochoriense]